MSESIEQTMLHQVRERYRSGPKPKFLFFWGHRESPRGDVTISCLSQWFGARFDVDGVAYPTAEHYMMAEKARLFGDDAARQRILQAGSPGAAKAIGREVRGFDESMWARHRFEIVCSANLAKFSQDVALKEFLLRTGNKVLVEASPVDRIWGIGLAADTPEARNPLQWRGLNLLGFALMRVRSRLESVV